MSDGIGINFQGDLYITDSVNAEAPTGSLAERALNSLQGAVESVEQSNGRVVRNERDVLAVLKKHMPGNGTPAAAGGAVTSVNGMTGAVNLTLGEVNTGSSLGGGADIFVGKVGVDLQFRSLVAGANITLTEGAGTVTIASNIDLSPYALAVDLDALEGRVDALEAADIVIDGRLDALEAANTGDQNLFLNVTDGVNTATASTLTDTLTFAATGSASVTVDPVTKTVTIDASGGGGGSALEVLDEGVSLTANATSLNFVGDAITATNTGSAVTITVDAPTQAEFDTLAGNNTGTNTGDQNVFTTVAADTGTATVNSPTTTLNVVGTGGIATSATGQTVTVDATALDSRITTLEGLGAGIVTGDSKSARWVLGASQDLGVSLTGTTTVLDFDTAAHDSSLGALTNDGTGAVTINETGIYSISTSIIIESPLLTAIESTGLAIRIDGTDLVTAQTDDTTLALGNNVRVLSTSVIIRLTAGQVVESVVNLGGEVGNGRGIRLPALFGSSANDLSHLSIAKLEVGGAPSLYDQAIYINGQPPANTTIFRNVIVRNIQLPANGLGSQAFASATPTADAVFSIRRNGTEVGTVTFAALSNTATFATSGGLAVDFVAGDRLEIVSPDPQDATLADISITLALLRST